METGEILFDQAGAPIPCPVLEAAQVLPADGPLDDGLAFDPETPIELAPPPLDPTNPTAQPSPVIVVIYANPAPIPTMPPQIVYMQQPAPPTLLPAPPQVIYVVVTPTPTITPTATATAIPPTSSPTPVPTAEPTATAEPIVFEDEPPAAPPPVAEVPPEPPRPAVPPPMLMSWALLIGKDTIDRVTAARRRSGLATTRRYIEQETPPWALPQS